MNAMDGVENVANSEAECSGYAFKIPHGGLFELFGRRGSVASKKSRPIHTSIYSAWGECKRLRRSSPCGC